MSSTKRGGTRKDADYYVTPVRHVSAFLDEFISHESSALTGAILDSCAGGDKWHPMSYPVALMDKGVPKSNITTVDIRKDSRAAIKADYLEWQAPRLYSLIISNPPFMLAQEFIEKALKEVVNNGFVVMLLRLNYFGSKKRKAFWKKHMPKYSFVHVERMSFTDDGKTDSIEYMHAVWQKGYNSGYTKLYTI